jgi:hypothetical protein
MLISDPYRCAHYVLGQRTHMYLRLGRMVPNAEVQVPYVVSGPQKPSQHNSRLPNHAHRAGFSSSRQRGWDRDIPTALVMPPWPHAGLHARRSRPFMSSFTRVVGSPARGPAVPRRRVQRALEVKTPLVEGENLCAWGKTCCTRKTPPRTRRCAGSHSQAAAMPAGLDTYG